MSEVNHIPPENILYIWRAITEYSEKSVNYSKVIKFLTNQAEYSKELAQDLVKLAIKDGFLVPIYNNRSTENVKSLRIPYINEIIVKEDEHDWYCYECHKNGDLRNCVKCFRSFHEDCWRKNPDMPNKILTNLSDELKAKLEIYNDCDKNQNNNANLMQSEITYEYTKNDLQNGTNPLKVKIVSLDEMRVPNQNNFEIISLKTNSDNSNNYIEEKFLCSVCRLMKREYYDPPNMTNLEINYLLQFVFNTIRTWISSDTFSPGPTSNTWAMPKQHFETFSKMCFKYPKTLEAIDEKLKNKAYLTLSDFQCDILDIRHCIGVLYGTDLIEYLLSENLMYYCFFELSEIRLCVDCYRSSNEKADEFWFCKPCVPRHELVFAKQKHFSYWPAKVIKVINNKYDVRYFGDNHQRAIINADYTKPIDTDIEEMKIKKTRRFLKAMDELRKHQHIMKHTSVQLSRETEIEQNNNQHSQMLLQQAGKPKTKTGIKRRQIENTQQNKKQKISAANKENTRNWGQIPKPVLTAKMRFIKRSVEKRYYAYQVKSNSNNNKVTSENVMDTIKTKINKLKLIPVAEKKIIKIVKTEIESFEKQTKKQHEKEVKETKKHTWCFVCGELAILHCCWNGTYCSVTCQKNDWRNHKPFCITGHD